MTVLAFLQKWQAPSFTSSTTVTPEFSAFARDFRTALRKSLISTWELIGFQRGHFYCSGFLRHQTTGQYLYSAISDVRFFPDHWATHLLVRTARNAADYTGGLNHYIDLMPISEAIQSLVALAV